MKKILIIALVLGLSLALLGPASAGKKKKKKKAPKPFTSEEVSIELGHPVFNGNSADVLAVTAQEFRAACSIPSSNGFDGYVFEVPAAFQKLSATVEATGTSVTDAASPADMDMYFFDESCAITGAANAEGTDEFGAFLPGTAFIFLHNFTGGPTTAQITIAAMK